MSAAEQGALSVAAASQRKRARRERMKEIARLRQATRVPQPHNNDAPSTESFVPATGSAAEAVPTGASGTSEVGVGVNAAGVFGADVLGCGNSQLAMLGTRAGADGTAGGVEAPESCVQYVEVVADHFKVGSGGDDISRMPSEKVSPSPNRDLGNSLWLQLKTDSDGSSWQDEEAVLSAFISSTVFAFYKSFNDAIFQLMI